MIVSLTHMPPARHCFTNIFLTDDVFVNTYRANGGGLNVQFYDKSMVMSHTRTKKKQKIKKITKKFSNTPFPIQK